MKQDQRRQQTIRLILDTTKELVRDKGCQAITMKDIMDKSGLSKGAIFHYVNKKDEIFAWVLQERLEETDRRFTEEVERGDRSFDGPMRQIASGLSTLEDPGDVTNKVLLYLLGKEDDPTVGKALREFYERSVTFSGQWIRTGQRHGVIPEAVDADETAELFVLLSLGLRVRSALPVPNASFKAEQFSALIGERLQGKSKG